MVKVMYIPVSTYKIMKGFTVLTIDGSTVISIVDTYNFKDLPVIRDVEFEFAIDSNDPADNVKLFYCMSRAKLEISDEEWDAMRREAIQHDPIMSRIIPTSKMLNNVT